MTDVASMGLCCDEDMPTRGPSHCGLANTPLQGFRRPVAPRDPPDHAEQVRFSPLRIRIYILYLASLFPDGMKQDIALYQWFQNSFVYCTHKVENK